MPAWRAASATVNRSGELASASDAPCSRGESPVSIEPSAPLAKLEVARWASKTVPPSASSRARASRSGRRRARATWRRSPSTTTMTPRARRRRSPARGRARGHDARLGERDARALRAGLRDELDAGECPDVAERERDGRQRGAPRRRDGSCRSRAAPRDRRAREPRPRPRRRSRRRSPRACAPFGTKPSSAPSPAHGARPRDARAGDRHRRDASVRVGAE